jgi:hypothetical protein
MLQEFIQLQQRHRALSHDLKSFAQIADVKYNYNKPDTKVKGRLVATLIITTLLATIILPLV